MIYSTFATNEIMAKIQFKERLKQTSNETIVSTITKKNTLSFFPEDALTILMKADFDTIKERFKKCMYGNLFTLVETMIENKHRLF